MICVIGAGAAGLTAGIHAAAAGAEVIAVDSAVRPGAKIRISGGGRCNVLPSEVTERDFHTRGSVNVVRRLLRTWRLDDVHAWFEGSLGVPLKTEATGKVFPVSDDADDVVAALLRAAAEAGVELRTGTRVQDVTPDGDGWSVATSGGRLLADRVICATGGLSLPKTGSDGAGYRFTREVGHPLEPTYPALVPLHLRDEVLTSLSGLAVPATISAVVSGKVRWRGSGDLLLTHHGISGPVGLDASHQVTAPWSGGAQLQVAFGREDAQAWSADLLAGGRRLVSSALGDVLPSRLAAALVSASGVPDDRTLGDLRRDERLSLLDTLTAYPLAVAGDGGYRKAEVTGGGVALGSVDPRTLESRHAPGLHLAGEVLDVTGRLGGYNFLWAWVTGRLAGQAAAAADQIA